MHRFTLGHLHRWVLLCVVCGLATLVLANEGKTRSPYANSYALLIGINEYPHLPKTARLNYAGQDVESLRTVLHTSYGFPEDHITLLTNAQATKAGIQQALARLSDKRFIGPDDRVLIYFSGHGQTVKIREAGEMGFLLPSDADVDMADINNAGPYLTSCLSMDTVWNFLEPSPARHILLMVDACYSGYMAKSRDLEEVKETTRAMTTLAYKRALQVITAGGSGEPTFERPEWGHGAFTYKFLEELTAHAKLPGKAFTAHELFAGLQRAVADLTNEKQNPQMACRNTEGEFLFIPDGAAPDFGEIKPVPSNAGTRRDIGEDARRPDDILAEGTATTREAAVTDAQWQAIHQAMCDWMSPDTIEKNQQLLDKGLTADAYVKKMKIVNETHVEDNYHAFIRTQIKNADLSEALEPLWPRMKIAGKPKVMLLTGEETAVALRAPLLDALKTAGFATVNADKLQAKLAQDAMRSLRDGRKDEATLSPLKEAGIEFVIEIHTATSEPKKETAGDIVLYSCRATLEGTLARVADDQTVDLLPVEKSTAGDSTTSAMRLALKKAAEAFWEENAGHLLQVTSDPYRQFLVKISETTEDAMQAVMKSLAKVPVIKNPHLATLKAGVAFVTLTFRGDIGALSVNLKACDTVLLEVKEIKDNTILATAKPVPQAP